MLKKLVAKDRGLEVQYWYFREDLIKILLGLQYLVKFPRMKFLEDPFIGSSCSIVTCTYNNTEEGRETD
jgi:hypothetical protein